MLMIIVSMLLSSAVLICFDDARDDNIVAGDPVTYSVTYDLNGCTGTTPTESVKAEGDTFTVASASGLTGPSEMNFKHWNTLADGAGNGYVAGSTITMPAGNLTLYAIWAFPFDYDTDTWHKESSAGFIVTFGEDASNFLDTLVDDVSLTALDYTVTGDTVVTLLSSYLETLTIGEHELTVKFNGSTTMIMFNVSEPEPEDTKPDILGFSTMLVIIIVVMILASSGLLYLFRR
jgi:Listeria-Bacteroides repeat domain (List_Bact_rpt)./Domain of unknown function.